MKKVLFVCSQNKLRSPTAEQVFSTWPGVEASSAGTNHDAEEPLTGELVEWADLIFVMERAHRNIPDDYAFMDPALVTLLKARVAPHLP